MRNYAILDENIVVNIVVAETVEDAEAATGLTAVESTDLNLAFIGERYDAALQKFIRPQPFPSWTLDSRGDWKAPTAMPNDNKEYYWDEEGLTWEVSQAGVVA